MISLRQSFLYLLFAFHPIVGIFANLLSPDRGTIIVSYQMHPNEDTIHRLDRIRFWLINEQEERTLYPKKDEFVSNNQSHNERTVVISHLPAGNYRIEFLVPNADNFFEKIPSRSIILTKGEVSKIEQMIHAVRRL